MQCKGQGKKQGEQGLESACVSSRNATCARAIEERGKGVRRAGSNGAGRNL